MQLGARKTKPRVEVETIIKEKAPTPMPEIVTEEPEFELDDIDTKILPPWPRYRKVNMKMSNSTNLLTWYAV